MTKNILTRSALIIFNMQNDTVHADGAFASIGVAEQAAAQNVLGNSLIAERRKGFKG